MGLIRRAFASRADSTAPSGSIEDPRTPIYKALAGGMGTGLAGRHVSELTAMQLSAVFACVALIAETLGTLPITVYSKRGTARLEVPPTAAAARIFVQPNEEMTGQFLVETFFGHALLNGNAFLHTPRNQLDRVVELWPVDPRKVRLGRGGDGRKVYAVGDVPFTSRELVHMPAFSYDGLSGLSRIALAREGISLGLAAEEFGARFFGDGSTLGGVIKVPEPLEEGEADRLLAQWDKYHRGLDKAWGAAVLDAGAEWQQIGIPPQDAQFLETRKFQVEEIARLFRVPPHLIGHVDGSTSWGSGIEEQDIAFVTFTLRAWVTRWEQFASRFLVSPEPRYVKMNVDALMRGSTLNRYQSYHLALTDGWMNRDEVREKEDKPPMPGGQEFLVPLNMGPSTGSSDPGQG